MAALVKVRGLIKTYKRRWSGNSVRAERRVLDDVNLDIEQGSVLGLVGESGCGKTTLSRALLFLLPVDSGTVEFDGKKLNDLSKRELRALRCRMQIVFQDPASALDPRMNIHDSLAEGLQNLKFDAPVREKRIREALELVGVPYARLYDFPYQFSGGQKQRISIARSLIMRPSFIVLDEPVSSLDVSVQAQIINLLNDLKKELGLTYLFISHDLDLVNYMTDNIAVMKDGKIVNNDDRFYFGTLPINTHDVVMNKSRVSGGKV